MKRRCFCTFAIICSVLILPEHAKSQEHEKIWDAVLTVEANNMSYEQKLIQLVQLKKQFEKGRFAPDSVYARILHRIGGYECLQNNGKANNDAIYNTNCAVKINTSASKGSCLWFAANSYFNLGTFYRSIMLNNQSLNYFDSALQIAKKFHDPTDIVCLTRYYRVDLFFQKGDYEKVGDESKMGINEASAEGVDSLVLYFYSQLANCLFYQGQPDAAIRNADSAIFYAKKMGDANQLAQAYKIKAKVYAAEGAFKLAENNFLVSIQYRSQKGYMEFLPEDYIDFGNFFLDSLHNYNRAEQCYSSALLYAKKIGNIVAVAKTETNLGAFYFYRTLYAKSLQHNTKAIAVLVNAFERNLLQLVTVNRLARVSNKELLFIIFGNRTETLKHLFEQTNDKNYLSAALQTAKLTDSILVNIRHNQTGEQSKLYWRSYTKWFYFNALEICYLANNSQLAFYFMERSRAVLLGDALNELGASAHLPIAQAEEQEQLQIDIVEAQQKLASLDYNSYTYRQQEKKLLQAKDDHEHFIKSLEKKYPAYYQYKYADDVPSLSDMQKYLAVNNQSFIHYFISDTVEFVLATTSSDVKFIRLSAKQFNPNALADFQQFCSDKQRLENNYNAFAKQANMLYKTLFKPLQIPPGKVIICGDDFLVPFEAFCTDTLGKQFLVSKYAFSYVYSASYLLKKLNTQQAGGNFLGIAPVSFASYTHVADLSQSADAIKASQQYYSNSKSLLLQKASRQNFFTYTPGYAVVTVLSHASADTTDKEPVIFMNDSAIHLSELLYLNKPATQLVILSACQTNVGKKATGEGIYSLARGFSAAGIPAVAATLWQADDQAIYTITQTFNQNIAHGMCKDEALQKAKLAFLQSSHGESLLPYYWANLIIAGNVHPVQFYAASKLWLFIAIIIIAFVVCFWVAARRRMASVSRLRVAADLN